jgi:hydroxylamine reductase (hybrid-cluster protein)
MKKRNLKRYAHKLRVAKTKKRLQRFNKFAHITIIKPLKKVSCHIRKVIGIGSCSSYRKDMKRYKEISKFIKKLR